MSTTIDNPTGAQLGSSRAGAIGALIAAATFVFGIALYVTTLSDYTEGDPTAAESVDFLVGHQTTLFAWYLVIFLVFGVAIIPLARTLHRRLADVSPQLADIGAVFAYIWAGLMFATVSGILMALFLDNVGGAWDNAKKYVELGNFGGKGSEAHKASVTGDTVGDPFKDTAGPALHVVIKLLSTTVLVLGPLFVTREDPFH